ncbi:MAG TPA: acetyl-CoA carboxylase biotin carboxyl carrier protein subunit [Candidatus Limiplasma sp.]|nr:acetyl-CoA carboxylase biotin carboxyl carrier protein subunit [Candidatus Limiplasma sp.]HPS80370.1 acetyl-CoA carboxylase biotin carboxyl carrier protein subunit [Candidatus Limiplasma sp.]
MKKILSVLFTLALLSGVLTGPALAETTFDGTVVSGEAVSVTAPFGGTVSSFKLREGDQINVGDVIAQVETTKVYASTDGVVTGVFGQAGDSVSDVVSRVGAVLYIEPTSKYSITADIQNAYNDSDNKYVNIGETVYIHSYSSSYDHTAVGTITAVSGTTYTVETTEGELLMEETVNIYRDEDYTASSRIGRGTVSRTAEVAVGADSSSSSSSNSGSGSSSSAASSSSGTVNSILTLHVKDGDTVERGQLLYETVTGSLDGLYATSNEIVSDVSGIVASVGASSGSSISKGNTLITVYPRDKMQVEIEIDEYDLVDIQEGDLMSLQFNYSDASTDDAEGTVSMISNVSASTDTSDVTYKAYVDFIANDKVRLGMTVVATVEDNAESDASAQPTESAASPAEDVQEATAE